MKTKGTFFLFFSKLNANSNPGMNKSYWRLWSKVEFASNDQNLLRLIDTSSAIDQYNKPKGFPLNSLSIKKKLKLPYKLQINN